MDASATDLELFRDQGGIHVVINSPLTDPGDIVLVKLHFTWWLVGEVMPTKSLAYTTEQGVNLCTFEPTGYVWPTIRRTYFSY